MINFYHLHFFKIKSREINKVQLIDFLEENEKIFIEETNEFDETVTVKIEKPNLGLQFDFVFTKKSSLQDLTTIDPKYLEINVHVKIPILTADYNAKAVFNLVRKICNRFDIFVYNEFFTDVQSFNFDTVFAAFKLMKQNYVAKYPNQMKDKIALSNDQLTDVLHYLEEQDSLANHYNGEGIILPNYFFLVDNRKIPYIAFEWREMESVVFPPKVDVIYYHYGNNVKIISYTEVIERIGKYLNEVPGFLPGTKVVNPRYVKKIHKLIRKTRFSPFTNEFKQVDITNLIDV